MPFKMRKSNTVLFPKEFEGEKGETSVLASVSTSTVSLKEINPFKTTYIINLNFHQNFAHLLQEIVYESLQYSQFGALQ